MIPTLHSWIRADERLPVDFDFTDDLVRGDEIGSWQTKIYDIADDMKKDIRLTVLDAAGRSGHLLRLSLHEMTAGIQYHVEAQAETAQGQTIIQVKRVLCGTRSVPGRILPAQSRQSYLINYEDRIPAGLSLVAADCIFHAYRERNLTEDVITSIKAGHVVDGRTLELRLENGEAGEDYLVHVLASAQLDPVTNSRYLAGATLSIPCREI